MHENKLCAKNRKKKFQLFRRQEALKKVDLIQWQFQTTKPNEKWFTDVSELPFSEKKLCFSAIIDGYNNEILSSAISTFRSSFWNT